MARPCRIADILPSSRLLALACAALAAAAAWFPLGTLGFDAPGGARIALFPATALPVALALVAAVAVFAIGSRRLRETAVAVSPLVFVLLPWLPFRVPAPFLIWTGAFASLPWIAVAIGLAITISPDAWDSETSSRSHARAAAAIAFVLFSLAAWRVSPALPAGDEPHYLVITQSLLYDHDLEIENNHRRGDYHAYFAGDLQPDFIRRGRNGEIYSIHAPGVPALVLPAFAIGGYRGVVVFLILIASCAAGLAWWLGWLVTRSIGAAWFGWAAACLTAPFLLESFTVYPDGVGAAVVLTGVWALLRAGDDASALDHQAPDRGPGPSALEQAPGRSARPAYLSWLLHGAALAMLPWMHTRFAVLAATLGGLILVRLARASNPTGKAIAFLSIPALGAIAWMFFFAITYGTPDPSAPYGGRVDNSFAYLDNGLGGLLLDQGFGLFAAAPVLALALAGLTRVRRLALDLAIVAVPYFLAVATFAMWWAGWSGPARFVVPLVLVAAIPAACAWKWAPARGVRAVLVTALVASLWIAAIMAGAGAGRLAYHSRNEAGATAAPWLEWANHVVDLPAALPAFVPLPVGSAVAARHAAARAGFSVAAVWVLCLGAAALVIFRLKAEATRLCTSSALAFGVAAMAAAGISWRVSATEPVSTVRSQMDVLRAVAEGHVHAVDLTARRSIDAGALTGRMLIAVDVPRGRPVQARGGRPLATFALLPAGDYELRAVANAGDGWLMAGVGTDQFSIITQPLSAFAAGVRVRLPVAVRALTVRGDELARDRATSIELRPLRVLAPGERLSTDMARRAVRYGTTTVFFLDERAFAEPNLFWVGGRRSTSIVIAPDQPSQATGLLLRNGAVANTVTVRAAGSEQVLQLAAGEERRIDIPIDATRGAALVTLASASGFRPSDLDPHSRDTRFLGVSVRTAEP